MQVRQTGSTEKVRNTKTRSQDSTKVRWIQMPGKLWSAERRGFQQTSQLSDYFEQSRAPDRSRVANKARSNQKSDRQENPRAIPAKGPESAQRRAAPNDEWRIRSTTISRLPNC